MPFYVILVFGVYSMAGNFRKEMIVFVATKYVCCHAYAAREISDVFTGCRSLVSTSDRHTMH